MIQFDWQPSLKHLRVFALGQVAIISLLIMALAKRGISTPILITLGTISLLIALCGAVRPSLVRHVYLAWMLAFFPVGWIVSYLLLGSIFWLVMMPLGLVLRFLGIDPLERRFDPNRTSYWTQRPPAPPASRYFRQF